MLKFVLQVVDGFLQIFDPGLLVTGPADVLDGIAEVEVQTLVTYEVPDLNPATPVILRTAIAAAH